MSFELVDSLSIEGCDGNPCVSRLIEIPSFAEGCVSLLCSGVDGKLRHAVFQLPESIHGHNFSSSSTHMDTELVKDVICVGSESYPILTASCIWRENFILIAYGGLGKRVTLAISSQATFPLFSELLTMETSTPITHISITNLSYQKQEKILWHARMFYTTQDKSITMDSISVNISPQDLTATATKTGSTTFEGHSSIVRCISFNQGASGDYISMISSGDDFSARVWPMNPIHSNVNTTCQTLESHKDDVICLDCKSGWLVTGSKDKSAIFWNLNPAKNARAEKNREVKCCEVHIGTVVKSCLISDDGTMAFLGGADGSIRVLRRFTHPEYGHSSWPIIHTQQLHQWGIDSLVFSHQLLITSSLESKNSIAVWKIPQFPN